MLAKSEKKVADAYAKLTKLGKKPVRTAEMIRIEKAIQDLKKIVAIEQTEAQIAEDERDCAKTKTWIEKRTATLQTKFKPKSD